MKLFESLVSGQGVPPNQQKSIAKALRRQDDISTIGMLTGNSVMAPGAKVINDSVQTKTNQLAAGSRFAANQKYQNRALAQSSAIAERTAEDARNRQADTVDYRDRALEQALTIAEMEKKGRLDVANSAMRAKEQEKLYADVKSLGKDMRDSNTVDIIAAMDNLNSVMAKYPSGDNIPGAGGIMNTYLGKISSEGREFQQAISEIRNILLKARSGGAVTVPEAKRFDTELGSYLLGTDDDIRKGVKILNNRISKTLESFKGSYNRPGVMEAYLGSGGRLSLTDYSGQEAGEGDQALTPAEQEELALYEKEFGNAG